MIASERLGIGHQFPALLSQLVHQTHESDALLGMASGNQLPVIEPELFDLARPALTPGDKAELSVFPLH